MTLLRSTSFPAAVRVVGAAATLAACAILAACQAPPTRQADGVPGPRTAAAAVPAPGSEPRQPSAPPAVPGAAGGALASGMGNGSEAPKASASVAGSDARAPAADAARSRTGAEPVGQAAITPLPPTSQVFAEGQSPEARGASPPPASGTVPSAAGGPTAAPVRPSPAVPPGSQPSGRRPSLASAAPTTAGTGREPSAASAVAAAQGPLYRCVRPGGDLASAAAIVFEPQVEALCRRHPEMGPCQYERQSCRKAGGRVFTASGVEVTGSMEAEYDRRVTRIRFTAH